MKTSKLHVVSALLALFVLRMTVAAQDIYSVAAVPNPLATRSFSWDQLAGTTSFQLYLGINHGLYTDTLLFNSYTFASADSGKTFVVTQAQDPDFNALVGQLTDGNSDWIACELWINGGVIGQAQEERNFFAPLPPGNNGTDLGGFPIDNIALRIDQANLGPSGSSIGVTFFVNSAPVPEPASGALLGLAVVLGLWRARSAKR